MGRTFGAAQAQAAVVEVPQAGAVVVEVPQARAVVVEVHGAVLNHSLTMFGSMSPYCVVKRTGGDDAQVFFATKPHHGGSQAPSWEHTGGIDALPDEIEVQVWDKSKFYSDTFCGSAIIPCCEFKGSTQGTQEFPLLKQ